MNSSSSCRQVEEGLFKLNSQKLAVTAQMSGTSRQCSELPDTERNFRRISGTSGKTPDLPEKPPELPDLPAATHLKVLQKHFGARTKLLDTLKGCKRLTWALKSLAKIKYDTPLDSTVSLTLFTKDINDIITLWGIRIPSLWIGGSSNHFLLHFHRVLPV